MVSPDNRQLILDLPTQMEVQAALIVRNQGGDTEEDAGHWHLESGSCASQRN